jgi:hypothetical protein
MAKITTTGCKKPQMAHWKTSPEQLFDRRLVCSPGWETRFALNMQDYGSFWDELLTYGEAHR